MSYYTQNPFDACHPTFVTIDQRSGRIFQAEDTGNVYRFNMEDYLNEKFKNASPNYGSEVCDAAQPSLCGGFKTGLKVSFDDWLTDLDVGNTWSEFPDVRTEFEMAYEKLQAEEKEKQRTAPPAQGTTKIAYTSPWQAVINWARGSTSAPSTPPSTRPPVTLNPGPTPPTPSPFPRPPTGLPPTLRPGTPSPFPSPSEDDDDEISPLNPPSLPSPGVGGTRPFGSETKGDIK